jgi:hypothetical protein
MLTEEYVSRELLISRCADVINQSSGSQSVLCESQGIRGYLCVMATLKFTYFLINPLKTKLICFI